ncbi:cilia- and flagella-associated protein 107-like [Diadema setosum]|uniref:cilia- and flagella-associated protein 107-like n=1 Tax=Diadema setosum TaxID=31175 RepID=UPI003B3A9140
MAHGDPQKWSLPGWRIEQRYAGGVLIGNWSEERHKFEKGAHRNTSTQRMDYVHNRNFQPDIMTRRAAKMKNEGLDQTLVFAHHNKDLKNNLISWYDEQFNKRERLAEDTLPELRHWDGQKLAWEPEKSDHPLKGEPTNFGLKSKLQKKWQEEEAAKKLGEYHTTYGLDYKNKPASALVRQHYAPQRALSSRMHPVNKINKDLNLRSTSILQTPEDIHLKTRAEAVTRHHGPPPVSV